MQCGYLLCSKLPHYPTCDLWDEHWRTQEPIMQRKVIGLDSVVVGSRGIERLYFLVYANFGPSNCIDLNFVFGNDMGGNTQRSWTIKGLTSQTNKHCNGKSKHKERRDPRMCLGFHFYISLVSFQSNNNPGCQVSVVKIHQFFSRNKPECTRNFPAQN